MSYIFVHPCQISLDRDAIVVEWPCSLPACERGRWRDWRPLQMWSHTIPQPAPTRPLPTQTRGRAPFLVSPNKQLDTSLNISIHRRLCLPQGLLDRARHDPLITYCLLPRAGQLYSPSDQHPVPAIIDLLPPRWAPTHPTPTHLQPGDPWIAKQRQVHWEKQVIEELKIGIE